MRLAKLLGAIGSAWRAARGALSRTRATRSTYPAAPTPGNLSRVTASGNDPTHPPPLTRPLGRSSRLVQVGSSLYFRERHGTLWRVVSQGAGGVNLVLVGRRRERVADLATGRVLQ